MQHITQLILASVNNDGLMVTFSLLAIFIFLTEMKMRHTQTASRLAIPLLAMIIATNFANIDYRSISSKNVAAEIVVSFFIAYYVITAVVFRTLGSYAGRSLTSRAAIMWFVSYSLKYILCAAIAGAIGFALSMDHAITIGLVVITVFLFLVGYIVSRRRRGSSSQRLTVDE